MIHAAHKGHVTGVSWSADCRRLVTCGTDSTVAIWDSESGAPLHRFGFKAGTLACVAVSPMGLYVAGGSSTGTLSVVNVATATREIPEPSFLYNWLAHLEPQVSDMGGGDSLSGRRERLLGAGEGSAGYLGIYMMHGSMCYITVPP